MASHYDRLGVRPSASTEEVRTAYRALAQRLHPDRQAGATAAERALAERRMREINESWEVLRDPGRRAAYDRERLGAARPAAPRQAAPAVDPTVDDGADLVEVAPDAHGLVGAVARHLPWVVVAVLLLGIFVFSAYAANPGKRTPLPTTTQPVAEGSCLDVFSGPSTSVVPCSGPHDLRLVARVAAPDQCPAGTEARRLGADGLVDCVRAR